MAIASLFCPPPEPPINRVASQNRGAQVSATTNLFAPSIPQSASPLVVGSG
jgi:hypothetical protein